MLGRGGDKKEADYLGALDKAHANSWITDKAALNAGYLVCEHLDSGLPPRGSSVDLIAVQHLCPVYASGFRVLEQKTISGTFTVFDTNEWAVSDYGDVCFPTGGYGDINSSTQVIVHNSEDRELARSDLGTGTIGVLNGCEFKFDLTLDEGESVYILEVGHRGEISYTWEEISKPEAVGLSLGDL